MDLAKAELPGARFQRNHFFHDGHRYDLSWDQSEKNDSEFFRLQSKEHMLAWDLVKKAKHRKQGQTPVPPAELVFSYDKLEGEYAILRPYIGKSGTLQVNKLTLCYAGIEEEHLLVAAITDARTVIPADDAERLLRIPASLGNVPAPIDADALSEQLEKQQAQKTQETEQKLEQYYEQENTKLERWADDRRQALQLTIDELDQEIKELKRASRQLPSLQDKLAAKRQIKQKARERDKAMASYHEAKKQIEQEEDELLDDIEAKLKLAPSTEALFTIRWRLIR